MRRQWRRWLRNNEQAVSSVSVRRTTHRGRRATAQCVLEPESAALVEGCDWLGQFDVTPLPSAAGPSTLSVLPV